MNALFTIANILVCAKPTKLLHVYQPLIFSIAYLVLSLLHYAAGGSAIYTVLDWDNVSVALPTAFIVIFVLGILLHFFVFVIFKLRVLLYERLCSKTKIDIIQVSIIDKAGSKKENKYKEEP